jgi:peroxiredoxin
MAVKVGDKAKDFNLKDQNGKEIRLSELTCLRLPVPLAQQTGADTHRQVREKSVAI